MAPLIADQLLPLEEDCHWMEPTLPVNRTVTLFELAHTVVSLLAVPATVAGFTVTLAEVVLNTELQTPLVTFARYQVVANKLDAVYGLAVAPAISFQLVLSMDDCHWMLPVLPLKEIEELLVP